MTLQTVNLTPRIGSQILADKATLLSGERAAELRAVLEDRGVILMRGIDLTDEEEIAFATNRSERTVRQHAVAVYGKSGLGGRAELSAFFLEDLMLPGSHAEA